MDIVKVIAYSCPRAHDYSWCECAMIYDRDIAERLCCPSVLRRTNNGERRPNASEVWFDVQTRACSQACARIKRVICQAEKASHNEKSPAQVPGQGSIFSPGSDGHGREDLRLASAREFGTYHGHRDIGTNCSRSKSKPLLRRLASASADNSIA